MWSCFDFADGELEEKVFALRFSNSEVADEFKKKYEDCQGEMAQLLAGEDKPDEGGEAADAAEAASRGCAAQQPHVRLHTPAERPLKRRFPLRRCQGLRATSQRNKLRRRQAQAAWALAVERCRSGWHVRRCWQRSCCYQNLERLERVNQMLMSYSQFL